MSIDLSMAYNTIADRICADIGQCVLILGPELAVNQKGQNYKSVFRELIPPDSKSKYFDVENLFYFADEMDSDIIIPKVTKFYQESGDQVLMELIARLPLPLIINVCPDLALNKIYKKYKIDFEEGYFLKDAKIQFDDTLDPSKENPVIYNIFGTVALDNSLIFTHTKLYQTIEELLRPDSLPNKLQLYLSQKANCFIFLGFKYDSWFYQLICHKLGVKGGSTRKTNVSSPFFQENENVNIVMKSSFDMKFSSENPTQCVQKIIELCEANHPGALRVKNAHSSFSTFVSYARENADGSNKGIEYIVDKIEYDFNADKSNLYQLFRDRKELHYGDSIDSFMTRIGMGKTAIMVISDKYLKSVYCMKEALRIFQYENTEKRIFAIILEDAKIDLPTPSTEGAENDPSMYKQYWLEQCQTILKDPTRLENGSYDDYVDIYRFIDKFLFTLTDYIHLRLSYADLTPSSPAGNYDIAASKKQSYDDFLAAVFNKMTESN